MLEEHGINARIVSNVFPHVIAKIRVEELETVPLLTFSTVPSNTVTLAFKRLFDIMIALLLIVLSAPFMLLAMLLIKTTSPGPVLFRQKRSGLQGRVFTLYKFRSMYIDAETKREKFEQYNEMEGPVFKMKDDPRITPVGHFLRKSSIDELPQLWNVLKGDMSIVGPRPPIPEEVAKYRRWQRRRLSMRPGLTCIWQISGRNKINDFNEWVRLDLLYIDTWSFVLDIKIFLKTIPVVLFRKGAA
jgi:exopolysaccharide biosynthesis polyprenyl glycosylphosphotransferase